MSRARRRGCLRLILAAGLVAAAAVAAWAGWTWLTWPDVAGLRGSDPTTTAFIERYRAGERRAGREPKVAWRPVPYDRISPHLKRAVLVAEDIGFFDHDGFATDEIEAALRKAWDERRAPRGASTITQQLAKNLWLSPSRSPLRKLEEALLTARLERVLDKRRILELYLNVVELGPGLYGAEAASRRYFGQPASELDEHQAAQLAAALSRPATWHPGVTSRGYQHRVELILRRMERARFLWKLI